jgi:transcriptional regulator with XRE-family HTH domain
MQTMIDKDDRDIRKHLQAFVASRLEELGLNPAELARLTGDSPKQISVLMNGKTTPSSAFARRVARALQCSLDELLNNEIPVHH